MDKRSVRNTKKVIYDDVQFDSKLELFCYKQLKDAGIEFIYQPTQVDLIDSFELPFKCYEHIGKRVKEDGKLLYSTKRFDLVPHVRKISYTPDFAAPDNSWIIEVKGYPTDVFKLRWKIFKQYLMSINYTGVVMKPENQNQIKECIKLIKEISEYKD